ncbi:MAG: UDP-N-acetylmuramoyl-L-alanyl-D-glutamate--2,6-diaminopimelate ligase [Bosea sp.]|uniref:UDP-N-acetylmuramoyl-L-alanyl-D-glutamate--2, 6-diaminopimelate ligase n=1 Tax=unclassified Bosea (in: a-proteobacteria) TaxID=2653178 RepID=UPI000967B09D|nr:MULTISPECIES: UDP-N-acetylmuramoyl-L-alanyl-D-glutamate--2,6-diaminopimelate ligase [unclassified Bosea (in: a-proteobacteria)]MBN9456073.1 UDP-N-acetylmuramoyl-L-alanyl-D-glutamate--2,6-diaminopimelate ligase [Bosea sp. (in: a-proteobacteria)]OJV05770.1 MAG: UDP-N-acetylmuramoyl-L-alanyl-D-glutamate--2,6-diaminopimelate ligase [Bosea sp. 67-29]
MSWRLDELFPEIFDPEAASQQVHAVAFDSRKVTGDDVFVALAGARTDGERFILDAVGHGAVAVVSGGPRPADLPAGVAFAQVKDPRLALALAAATIHPRQPETIVAVTGTSGKSSVADFTRQIFQALGHESASLGTIGVVTAKGADYGSLTTPDPLSLHASLDRLAGEGVTHLAMEASSHGLDQRRLDGVRLKAGAFLNLGRDHLDYHPSVEDYLAAKLRLWELLPAGAPVVINRDEPYAEEASRAAESGGHPIIGIGRKGETLRLLANERDGFAQRLTVGIDGEPVSVSLPLVGDFMAGNALVAAGLAIATGADGRKALEAISGLTGVAGRLERVGEANGGLVVVDYAHKPDALAAVLATLRPYATGRLICVFGCGGDRDKGKRPLMGAIAAEKADIAIVTDDNPRSEDPATIRAEIMAASPKLTEIGDREEAIRAAVTMLKPGDLLVVAGKGHETGQIIGERTLPFSDHEVVRKALSEIQG